MTVFSEYERIRYIHRTTRRKGSGMKETIDGHVINYDRKITLPYNKLELDGEVTFYLEYNDYFIPASEHGPAEGGDYEVIYWTGEILDDDIPDMSSDAMAEADFLDVNDHPY